MTCSAKSSDQVAAPSIVDRWERELRAVGPPQRLAWHHVMRTIDLFSGCGGLSLGLERTGVFRSVLAVDFDRHATETYRANFGDTEVVAGPIEDVTAVPKCGRRHRRATLSGILRAEPRQGRLRAARASGASTYGRSTQAARRSSSWRTCRSCSGRPSTRRSRKRYAVVSSASPRSPERRRLRRAAASTPRDRDRYARAHNRRCPNGRMRTRSRRSSEVGSSWRTFRDAVHGLPLEPDGRQWHRSAAPDRKSLLRYAAVPHDGGNRFQMQANLEARDLGHLVPTAGGASRPGRPTSSVDSGGTGRRSPSAPSSTSPRRAATSTRRSTARSRSGRPRT